MTSVMKLLLLVLVMMMLLLTSERAAGRCDFDHRWSYETRACSAWSTHNVTDGHFLLLTGSQLSNDDVSHSLLPLTDHSERTPAGALLYA